MKNLSDLRINGHGSASGGKYNSVNINGSGKIDGDLECIYLKINGQCNLNGNVTADQLRVNGNNSIKGNLEVNKMKINGTTDIKGNLSAEKAETYGSISVEGDCNAEFFKIEGTFGIDGLLNADELELRLHGSSRAGEIGGSKITIKRKGKYDIFGLKGMIMPFGAGKELITETIEGDEIYLENTQAKVVRGDTIELGPGCEIELVEYNSSFKMHNESSVTEQRKS